MVRNFSGRIFNRDRPCKNTAFEALADFAQGGEVADQLWDAVLAEALVEAGFPSDKSEAFLTAFRALDEAETAQPGTVDEAKANALVAAARSLGEAVSPERYPAPQAMAQEGIGIACAAASTNGIVTASTSGVSLSEASTGLSSCTARVPPATPP